MSPYPQYTLKSPDVYTLTINTLDTLPLTMPGAMQSCDLGRVLVFAAAAQLAVPHACHLLERAPSGPTGLGTLAQQGADLAALAGHAHALLARLSPPGLGHRGRRVAIELSALPQHGTVDEAPHDAVCRRTAQGGTTHCFTYAPAQAVVRGRRYPLALCRVRAKPPLEPVVRLLLARLGTLGSRIKLVLRERGFYRVRGIRALLTAELPCIMPAVHRGKPPPPPGGPPGTQALAAAKQGRGTSYPLQSAHEGHGDCALAVLCHTPRGQRGRHQREALVEATWGVKQRP